MQRVEFTSKLMLVVIVATAISVGIGVQTYNIQAADAAAKLPDNSVRSETIVNGQVKAEDIAAGVIPTGDPGQLVVTERSSVSEDVEPNTNVLIGVNCNSDEIPTGGGFDGFGLGDEVWVQSSHKGGSENNGWQVLLTYVSGPAPRDITVYAECAKIVP